MPIFEIEQYELHTQKYRVEADSEAHAIQRLFADEADPIDGTLEYVEIVYHRGLPVSEAPELTEARAPWARLQVMTMSYRRSSASSR